MSHTLSVKYEFECQGGVSYHLHLGRCVVKVN